jgi:hypothetical protein
MRILEKVSDLPKITQSFGPEITEPKTLLLSYSALPKSEYESVGLGEEEYPAFWETLSRQTQDET